MSTEPEPEDAAKMPDVMARRLAEIKAELREEFRAALAAERDLLITGGISRHEKALLRVDAVEQAARVFEENLNRVPTVLDREVRRMETIFEEKLKAVGIRIDTFHTLASALRENAKEATASALAALKEMNAKGEAATTKEIDSLKGLISATNKEADTGISNLTDRLNRGEGAVLGGKGVGNLIVGVAGVAGILVAVFVSLHTYSGTGPTGGADTKRMDDLILQSNENARQMAQRMDALSARLNQLTPILVPSPKPETR